MIRRNAGVVNLQKLRSRRLFRRIFQPPRTQTDTKNFSRTKTNQHIHHIHHSHSAADLHQSKSLWYTKVTLFIEF